MRGTLKSAKEYGAMSAAPQLEYMTPAEYLAVERQAEHRHELFNGIVVAMAGGSIRHSILTMNMGVLLHHALAPRGCLIGSSDTRVRIPNASSYFYPDVVVMCETPQAEDEHDDVLLNPTAVVEVLSPSTEAYDRGAKAEAYRSMPSLHTLIFVSQDRHSVDWFERQGDFWAFHEAIGLDAAAVFGLLNVTVPLAELYAGVELQPPTLPAQGSS